MPVQLAIATDESTYQTIKVPNDWDVLNDFMCESETHVLWIVVTFQGRGKVKPKVLVLDANKSLEEMKKDYLKYEDVLLGKVTLPDGKLDVVWSQRWVVRGSILFLKRWTVPGLFFIYSRLFLIQTIVQLY